MILDLTEFLKRAYAVGIMPIVSGTTIFLSKNGTTVRVKLDEQQRTALRGVAPETRK
jgi:hypothetical protein